MSENTKFTKRDREFIISLAGHIEKLRKDFEEFKAVKPEKVEAPQKKSKKYKHQDSPVMHVEFYKTDDKDLQVQQYMWVESLESILRELCIKNGVAYLNVEIDTREE